MRSHARVRAARPSRSFTRRAPAACSSSWCRSGKALGSAAYTALILGWTVAFVALLFALSRRPHAASLGASVLVGTALLCIGATALKPQRSGDLWEYAFSGRLVAHYHLSPFTHTASSFPSDPIARRVRPEFQHTPSVYGPLFAGISAVGMKATGTSPLAARLYFQGLAALCVFLATLFVWLRTRLPVAAAFVGLNPVMILGVVNNGHNDAIAGLLVLGAVLFAEWRLFVPSGLAAGAAVAVKASAGLPLLGLALFAFAFSAGKRLERRSLVRLMFGARLALAALAVVGIAYAVGGGTPAMRATFEGAGSHITAFSIFFRAEQHGVLTHKVAAFGGLGIAVVLGGLLAVESRSAPRSVAWVFAVWMLSGGYVLPWYIALALPAAALAWHSAAAWVVAAAGVIMVLVYRGGPAPPGPGFHLTDAVAMCFGLALVVLGVVAVRRARR